jgi:hypothetical protein
VVLLLVGCCVGGLLWMLDDWIISLFSSTYSIEFYFIFQIHSSASLLLLSLVTFRLELCGIILFACVVCAIYDARRAEICSPTASQIHIQFSHPINQSIIFSHILVASQRD